MDKEHRVSVYDMVKELNLKEVTPEINSKEVYIEQAEINRPALQLAGFFENFAQNRVQIIGKAEHLFIEEVERDVENAKNIYKRFIGAGIPVIVFCRNLHPSEMMIKVAKEYGVPVLISQDATSEFMAEVIRWLGIVLAPSITIHGVLVDVFGEGILITGESGIGKSEAALELIRRGYEVYVGKLDDLEVDFVCMDQKRIIYYQVAATVRDEKTLKRELLPLQKIHDHYQKILLTLDEDPEADYEGIRRINALDWLIGKTE